MIKPLRTKYSLLIALDLFQGHYQVFLMILLKDFPMINAQITSLILNIYPSEMNY